MKKILISLFVSLSSFVLAQNNIQSKQLFAFPTSAEAYSMSKVSNIPIDYYHGKVNIDIPIYSIPINENLNIPISITYNTGGIKLNEVASTVGLGWSLNIPGTINQTIAGLNDLNYNLLSKNISTYNDYIGYIDFTSQNDDKRNKLFQIINNEIDTKPDLFDYLLVNSSGSFILNNNEAFLVPNKNIKIIKKIDNTFLITDEVGIKYWLSNKDLVHSNLNGYDLSQNSTNFRVDSIKFLNKTIKFIFNKRMLYTENNIIERVNIKISPPTPGYNSLLPLPKYEKEISQTTVNEKLISNIKFDKGEVIFQYSDEPNLNVSDGERLRKDINSQNGKALRRIFVKNTNGLIIKDITFNYSYFESGNSVKSFEDYRLKLISIHNNLDNTNYTFSYNETYPIPKRNSNNDDYWGYINSINNNNVGSNIPLLIKSNLNIPAEDLVSIPRRDREPNSYLAKLGSLTSIIYPTGVRKNFYYESPFNEEHTTFTIPKHLDIDSISSGHSGLRLDSHVTKNFQVTLNDLNQILFDDGYNTKLEWGFISSCESASNNQPFHQIFSTSCYGTIIPNNTSGYTSAGPAFEGEKEINGLPFGTLNLSRIGDCHCDLSVGIKYLKDVQIAQYKYLPGLRIAKIEDIVENHTINQFTYSYGAYFNNKFRHLANLKQPYNFVTSTKRHLRKFDNYGAEDLTNISLAPVFEVYATIHSSSQSSNSYQNTDMVTYPSVIEKNDKGESIYEYEDDNLGNYQIGSEFTINYNKWKLGRLNRSIILNNDGDTLKIEKTVFNDNPLKNSLSGFVTSSPRFISFAVNMEIIPSKVQVMPGTFEGDIFYVNHKIDNIESAYEEVAYINTINFLSNKRLIKQKNFSYYDNNIYNPINIKGLETIFEDEGLLRTSIHYAPEKNNQYLIDKNIIGIPLETITTKTENGVTKIIANSEVKYPTSQAEADLKTSGLPLPYAVISKDIQNSGSEITQVTYDRYDTKGNLEQYTDKNGISTTVIWGYQQTSPIAKIEGAKYSDVQALIQNSIIKSNADINQATEDQLITELDLLRKNLAPFNFQVTTYTYDPLIGVTSITPPSGIREIYKYDVANRLEKVMDINGNILKEYKYNYKQ